MRAFFISCAFARPPFTSLVFLGESSFNPRLAPGWLWPFFFGFMGCPPWATIAIAWSVPSGNVAHLGDWDGHPGR
jgi:hypothetical protein